LVALLLSGTGVQAGEPVMPFHSTLQLVEDCESSPAPSELCLGFADWVAECQAKDYDWGFQVVRTGEATLMGRVTSFEQGCLDFPDVGGPSGILRSYVQLTITARNGDTLRSYAACMFDFTQANAPGTGAFSITGGTGRFAGARGSGTVGNVMGGGNPGWIIYQDGFLRLSRGKSRRALTLPLP
jgi:hypothetical protein